MVVYYGVGYRKRVVRDNLGKAFDEKSERERSGIARRFYRHLCDLIIESIKGCSVSRVEALARHRYTNIELLNEYYARGRSVTILGAHVANWEWVALSLPLSTPYQTHGIFQTINNPFLNRVAKASRERHGMRLVAKKEVAACLRESVGRRITMGYIGDQSPSRHGHNHWLRFLNQETAVTSGFEHFAKEYDTPVLYLDIRKVRRGYYEGTFSLITDQPRATAEGEIVAAFMSKLERVIRDRPEHWLWSHRRWKLVRDA